MARGDFESFGTATLVFDYPYERTLQNQQPISVSGAAAPVDARTSSGASTEVHSQGYYQKPIFSS